MKPLPEGMLLSDEIVLYDDDHAAWCQYAAPRIIERYSDEPEEVKRELWLRLSEQLRTVMRELRA